MLDLDQLLHRALDEGASDIHVKVGARPRLRLDGVLQEAPFETVEPADTERIAAAIMPPRRAAELQSTGEASFTYAIAGLGRFRVSAFRQRGFVGLVLRRVPPGIPTLEALGLPRAVVGLAEQTRGLVLVTGLAGSGKTATLAAMVDHVNSTRDGHIVTIEDPIEVLHADKRCIVDQREVGSDAASYAAALAHVLRQDPDVVMIGQLRDASTITAALQAAETGHLVLASYPTVGAVDTLERITEMFPSHQRGPVRSALAANLRGIVSQRLVPRARGRGRVPAVELLLANSRVAERVGDVERTADLEREMSEGELYGMQTFDQSVAQLYRLGIVTRDDAAANATHPSDLRVALDRADFARVPEGRLAGGFERAGEQGGPGVEEPVDLGRAPLPA